MGRKFMVIIVTIFLVILIDSVLSKRGEPLSKKLSMVTLPKFYLYFAIVVGFIFAIPLTVSFLENEFFHDPVYWLFLFSEILLTLMAISQNHWPIYIMEETFIYVNTFGKKRTVTYKEILYIKTLKSGDRLIKIENKVFPFIVDKYAVGWDCFIQAYNSYKVKLR
jgi:hypothetical protein